MDTKYILLVLGLLLLIAPGAALDGYAYNQSVSYSACDQSVYQQDVVIHRSTGTAYEETSGGLNVWHLYVGTDCQEDYDDLRFADATGTELLYYLWPDYDSSSARFCIRLEGATSAGALTVWYGNATATTTSDGDTVYFVFDHFDGDSVDSAKWDAKGNLAVAGGVCTVIGSGFDTSGISSKQSFGTGVIAEIGHNVPPGSANLAQFIGFAPYLSYNSGVSIYYSGGSSYVWASGNGGAFTTGGTRDAYAISRIVRSPSFTNLYNTAGDLKSRVAQTGNYPITFNNAGTAANYLDYILVRAYSAAPPAATAFLTGPAPEIPPTAAFTASPTSGTAPLTVQFTDASTGSPTAWAWTFGDGGTGAQQHPSHTYATAGTYTVTLTASNAYGYNTSTQVDYITVYEPGPYYVATYADLCKVGTGADGWTLDADYIQTADIQCPMDEDFPMICRYPTPFTGTYDGNGYEIQNMQIHTTDSYTGLFVLLGSTAEVWDVHLVDVDIDAYTSRVGALAGESQGQVSECTVSGTVAGAWGVGGLIGQMSSGTVANCNFSGNVSAPSHFGGLIGVMNSGSVEGCSSSGFTTGQYNGGLIGQLNGGTVTRCNSSVRVIGNSCGGLIGQMTAGSVAWCNATGDVGALVSDGIDFGRGGLVGRLDGGTISDSSATGSISGNNHLGGFVGYGSGMITRCFATGGIQRSIGCSEMYLAGGFVGRLDDGIITECYATGDVLNASYLCGGFLGAFEYGSVTDSYATGDVAVVVAGENRHAGGFIGRWGVWRNGPAGSITNCYSTGHVMAPAGSTDVGGFVGSLDTVSGPPATTSYWDTDTSGQAASAGGAVGKTTAEMKTIATFSGWSIATPAAYTDEVWFIVEGEAYPRLAWEGLPATPPTAAFSAAPTSGTAPLTVQFTDTTENTPTAWAWTFGDGGTGAQQHPSHTYDEPGTYTVSLTATNAEGSDEETRAGYITVYTPGPYSVTTYADLCKVGTGTDGWFLNASYVQTADIQCPAGSNFPIIGRDEIFEGSYDGGNHTIRGLSITSSDYSVGMFSSIGGGATLKNITLDNCNVSGIDNVGGLSGFSYGATVTNCRITGLVQGEDTIGGLIGFAVADPLYISNCIAEINVSGSGNLGGIVGELNAQNSLIDNCSVTGSIEGTGGRIGGITGSHYSGCLIRNCTASEVIIIGYSGYIGGISGEGQGGSTDGCYVSGTIRGEGTASAGGLIGFINQNGYVKNSTTSVTVTGGGNVGGLIGQNSGGTVDHCHVSGSVATSGNYATAGGLIGYSQASVSNCTASGSVAGNGGPIGGLIGGAYEGTYFQCSASGAVTNMGEGPTGGLFGQLGGSATECYATGPVTGVSFCGGFVGGCWGGSITDCYAMGSVTADGGHHIGGFAGEGSQSIVNCYSTGLVTATNVPDDLIEYLGGFSGGGDVPSSCFWNTETSGQAASAGGAVGKTTAEMKTIATFAGWNIAPAASLTDEVWQIVDGSTYPLFAWQDMPIGEQEPVAGFSADPVLGPAPLTVQFTDESTNEPTEWVWQFGDGATSFAQHPSHTYTEPGTYTVSLEAANSAGSDLVTEPDLITVQISDAVTFVGTPTTGGSPLTVRFTVVNGDPTWSYLWSFGDGETSTDQNPVHRYTTRADTANFTVTLTITQNGETETIERPDYIRIDTVGLDTFTATQQMNIESVVTVGAISSIIAGIIVVVFVL